MMQKILKSANIWQSYSKNKSGRVFWLTVYIVMKSDLHALSHLNDMCKYADDTTLLVSEHTDITIDMEFRHVKAWALTNHITLNLDKTKENVFN